jgi:hypothetical protein
MNTSSGINRMVAACRAIVRHGVLGPAASPRPKRVAFSAVFVLVFLLSGLLTALTSGVYRMGLVSALVIPLIVLYGLEPDFVLSAEIALSGAIGISALVNHASLENLILFLRIPAFSYLMYYLARKAVDSETVGTILRAVTVVAFVQLPVVIAQNILVGGIDADFGTFNYKTDYAMSFFVLMALLLVLFDHVRINRHAGKMALAGWLTLTVLAANSQITKVALVLVWAVYLLAGFRLRRVVSVLIVGLVGVGALWGLYTAGALSEKPIVVVGRLPTAQELQGEGGSLGDRPERRSYLEGGYDRAGAIRYFMSHPVSWFGDGPMKYYDVFTRTFTRGNVSHVFNFYSETGLVSLLFSIAVFFGIAFVPRWRPRWSMVGVLIFAAINILAFTSHVMNDIAVMLIYAIVGRAQWLLMDGEQAPPPGAS